MRIARRKFFKLLAGGVITLGGLKLTELASSRVQRAILRPPGAVEEDLFNQLCIRCGICLEVCPTKTIVLATFEDGIDVVDTPKLDPLRGPCEFYEGRCEDIQQCSKFCPTGALQLVNREEVKIGTAKLLQDKCLAELGAECVVCDEMCPVEDAITLTEAVTPIFHGEHCIGCGMCVFSCPAEPKALVLQPEGTKRARWPK